MTLINSAMRRVLAGDESLRALDPNGQRLRTAARVPRAVRARNAAAVVRSEKTSARQTNTRQTDAATMKARCAPLVRAIDTALGIDEPTPYLREPFPSDVRLPQVVRGFA